MNRTSRTIFIAVFLAILVLPVVFVNRQKDTVSADEKRILAAFPSLFDEDGEFDTEYGLHFEDWLNDNIGFRSAMVAADARIMYYGFGVLGNDSDYYLGPNGELCYLTDNMLKDYRHLNLWSEEALAELSDAYIIFSDYIESQGIQYYYYQCWDKQTIYPEHFPKSITRFGDISRTQQLTEALSNAGITVISPKDELIAAKSKYDTYSTWGDATHWTERGSFIGYNVLMNAINSQNDGKYKVLSEEDYNITTEDLGETIFGVIHEVCLLERFTIKSPNGYSNEPDFYELHGDDYGNVYYNERAGNDDTLVVIGDSYFESFLLDDLSESFAKVVIIECTDIAKIKEIVDTYHPTIIVEEHAERRDKTNLIIKAVEAIRE